MTGSPRPRKPRSCSVLIMRVARERGYPPLTVTAFVLLAGAIVLLPWLSTGAQQFSSSSTNTVASIIFLAVAPAAIGQTCWTYAIKRFGAARAGQFLYLIPPLAALFSWAFIGEVPSGSTLAGGVSALLGVVIVNTWGRLNHQSDTK